VSRSGRQEIETADINEEYLKDSVQKLCTIEVADRGLDARARDRVVRAFFEESEPEAERLAAKQAVAAALRRRVSSGTWIRMAGEPANGADEPGNGAGKSANGADESANRVDGLVRAFAIVLALDPNRPRKGGQADIASLAATRDRSKALHELRSQLKKEDREDRKSVEAEYHRQTNSGPLPSIANTRRVVHSMTTVVTTPVETLTAKIVMRIATVFGKGPRADASSQVVDPDPWGTPHNSAEYAEKPSDADKTVFAALLGVYSAQYASYTTLLWQVPALSLTAQAFLLTIALDGSSKPSKALAAGLSIIIALASVRLMHDQRGHAINHGELALRVSKTLGLADQLGDLNVDDAKPARANAETLWVGWDRGIYGVWKLALYLFLVADVIVLGLAIFT
jgi:hypothetical protein